jgi:hypothetical protein
LAQKEKIKSTKINADICTTSAQLKSTQHGSAPLSVDPLCFFSNENSLPDWSEGRRPKEAGNS